MVSCVISLAINGQPPISCMPVTDKTPLWLYHEGVASQADACAVLKIDGHNELVLESIGSRQVSLERDGRRINLRPGHAIRAFSEDCIYIENTEIKIAESFFRTDKTSHFARNLMVASAALSLSVCACHQANGNLHPQPCQENTQQCADNNPLVCKDGKWVPMDPCKDGETCTVNPDNSVSCERDSTLPGEVNRLAGDVEPLPIPPEINENNDNAKPVDVNCNGGEAAPLPPPTDDEVNMLRREQVEVRRLGGKMPAPKDNDEENKPKTVEPRRLSGDVVRVQPEDNKAKDNNNALVPELDDKDGDNHQGKSD